VVVQVWGVEPNVPLGNLRWVSVCAEEEASWKTAPWSSQGESDEWVDGGRSCFLCGVEPLSVCIDFARSSVSPRCYPKGGGDQSVFVVVVTLRHIYSKGGWSITLPEFILEVWVIFYVIFCLSERFYPTTSLWIRPYDSGLHYLLLIRKRAGFMGEGLMGKGYLRDIKLCWWLWCGLVMASPAEGGSATPTNIEVQKQLMRLHVH